MAVKAGSVSINLSVAAGAFARGLGKAKIALAGFAKSAAQVGAKVAKFGLAAGAAATGALALLTRQGLKNIDATTKFADAIGIATNKLAGLQHGAQIMGASTQELQTGLRQLAKNLGDAAQGTGEAQDAFANLGVDVAALTAMSPDKQMEVLADAFKAMENPTLRAQSAMRIFGRSGTVLVPLLMQGAAGMEAFQEEANLLGLSFNRLDAAKVESANDSITKLKAVFKGVGNTLAVQVAPFITELATRIVAWTTSAGGITNVVTRAFGTFVKVVAKAADIVRLLEFAWKGLRVAVLRFTKSALHNFNTIAEGVIWLAEKIGLDLSNSFTDFTKVWEQTVDDDLAATFDEIRDLARKEWPSDAVTQWVDDIQAKADSAAKAVADAQETALDTRPVIDNAKEQEKAAKKLADRVKALFNETRSPLENMKAKLADVVSLFSQGAIDSDLFRRAIAQITDKAKGMLGDTNLRGQADIAVAGTFTTGAVNVSAKREATDEDKALLGFVSKIEDMVRTIAERESGVPA